MTLKKRRLSDLYVKGKEVLLDDGEGEAVKVYIRKLNSIESEDAARKANAAKARLITAKRDKNSDEYLSAVNEAYALGEFDDWCVFLAEEQAGKKVREIEAEISSEDEWSKDDYLQGLYDAWNDGLKDTHAIEPTEETERVFSELKRFQEQVEKVFQGEIDNLTKDFQADDEQKILDRMVDTLLDRRGEFLWLREFRKAQVFYSTRDPETKEQYFGSLEEVGELHNEVFLRLVAEFNALNVDVQEGKSSPRTDDSSPSSEQPEEPVTEISSGLKVVEG